MFWDATYILVIIGAIISAIASWNVNQTYKKFSKFQNGRGLLAEDVAALLLHKAGIFDVRIEKVRGFLTDLCSNRKYRLKTFVANYFAWPDYGTDRINADWRTTVHICCPLSVDYTAS